MNPDQSFYGYDDWHLPSPTSTPHTSRFVNPASPSQDQIFSTPQFQSHWSQHSPDFLHSQANDVFGFDPYPQHTTTGSGFKKAHAEIDSSSPPKAIASRARASFPTTSFITKFEDATLQDNAIQGSSHTHDETAAYLQMRTPPPTRDASSRRKYQTQIREAKHASQQSLQSRRRSTPGDAWLKRNNSGSRVDGSTLHFSPNGFSSMDVLAGIDGPATVPVMPQSNLFWDPTSQSNSVQFSMPPINEDPFSLTSDRSQHLPQSKEVPAQSGQALAQTGSGHVAIAPGSNNTRPSLGSARRPQSAVFHSHGVDPSLLSVTASRPSGTLLRSTSFNSSDVDAAKQPYQFHFDQLKREKERQRAHEAAMRVSHSSYHDSAPLHACNATLRRTTSAHKVDSESSSVASAASAHDIRSSSPLKRQRSNAQAPLRSLSAQRLRRSIVLTVDDKGRARTQVKMAPSRVNNDDEDSSDDGMMMVAGARSPVLTNSGHDKELIDAQSALRDAIRSRRQRQGSLSSSNSNRESVSTHSTRTAPRTSSRLASMGMTQNHHWPSAGAVNNHRRNSSPRRRQHSTSSNFRCTCNAATGSGQPLIQCTICAHVLHMTCCGLNPLSPHDGFICAYCSSSPSASAGRAESWLAAPFQPGKDRT